MVTLREVVRRMSNTFRKVSVSERPLPPPPPPPTPVRCELPNYPYREPGKKYHYYSAAEELAPIPLSGHQSQPTTRPPTRATNEFVGSDDPNAAPGQSRQRALTRVVTGTRNLVRRLTASKPASAAENISPPTNFEHRHHE
ncbi:hypothetical protein BDZ45DRAFT_751360 [Acephala macrosclerotiorum]|nr:hypothetical protein BDZ45DRAFT_751360 [Acephala macrosclerotiorum]